MGLLVGGTLLIDWLLFLAVLDRLVGRALGLLVGYALVGALLTGDKLLGALVEGDALGDLLGLSDENGDELGTSVT